MPTSISDDNDDDEFGTGSIAVSLGMAGSGVCHMKALFDIGVCVRSAVTGYVILTYYLYPNALFYN